MNAVIGLSSILARSQPLSDRQREYITTLNLSAKSLLALINDLLDISKIESESIVLDNSPFSLPQLLEEVVSIMSVRAQQKGIDLALHFDPQLEANVVGDATRVRQVFLNLISNAVKFTEKGRVIVEARRQKSGAQLASAVIRVSDTGIGIPPEKLGTVFDKFSQGGSTISNKYGGTGLGLAITKRLINLMGGTISVASEQAKGSIFTITLPLATAAAVGDVLEGRNQNPERRKVKAADDKTVILLVEDYQPNILVATTMLENMGYKYDVATDGRMAIEKLAARRYDLVMMDVQMPEMDGYETTRRIRETEVASGSRRIPIIGVTAFAMKGDREKCLALGMEEYLSKPFTEEELARKIRSLLSDGGKLP